MTNKTTLVDRFYGAASTAPASVFANLIGMATKAHMPGLRKKGKWHKDLDEQLEQIQDKLYAACGFPKTLTLEQQGEFALGFYHQRAEFRKNRKQGGAS